jgi:hypothetical protein
MWAESMEKWRAMKAADEKGNRTADSFRTAGGQCHFTASIVVLDPRDPYQCAANAVQQQADFIRNNRLEALRRSAAFLPAMRKLQKAGRRQHDR